MLNFVKTELPKVAQAAKIGHCVNLAPEIVINGKRFGLALVRMPV